MMGDDKRIGRDLEGSGPSLMEVLRRYIPWGNVFTKILSQNKRCSVRDSNRVFSMNLNYSRYTKHARLH
jgi:hypothetical protein